MSDDSESAGGSSSGPESSSNSENTASPSPDIPIGNEAVRISWLRSLRPFESVDLMPLAFFRIFFGAMMLYHVGAKLHHGWVDFFYIHPDFHLTFPGLGWVKPWPGDGMYLHFGVMGLSALGILTGCFYRFSATIYAICFTYVFLLEKALYQNHYYLICLLSSIMIFVPAHRMWSIDAYWKSSIRSQTAPRIWLWLLRIQLAIPYFYGGLAKINYDWLHGMPMRIWLSRRTHLPVIGPWMTDDATVFLVAWGGLIFDLLVVPALLWKRTRVIAYLAAVAFHVSNHFLWNIGIFPWFMIGATLIFFPAGTIRRLITLQSVRRRERSDSPAPLTRKQRITASLIGVYLAWQLLFPFRHYLYPGDVSWTEEAHHFAWHMMLREKGVGIRFYMHNRRTDKGGLLKLSDFLGERQLSRMGKDADMVLEFVHYVRDHYREHGEDDIEIRVLALASLNGRKPQLLLDPHLDYAKVDRVWGHQPWIVPLHEPLRKPAWDLPLDQWDGALSEIIPDDMKSLSAKSPSLNIPD
jgi:vitamin K-dependent gamma-carboxylase